MEFLKDKLGAEDHLLPFILCQSCKRYMIDNTIIIIDSWFKFVDILKSASCLETEFRDSTNLYLNVYWVLNVMIMNSDRKYCFPIPFSELDMKCTSLDNFHFKHILSFFPNSLRTTFLQNAYYSCVFLFVRVQNPILLLQFPSVLP